MRLGVSLPTGNNGWIMSENSPQYMPTFELSHSIVSRAETLGFSFGLGMVTFRGYGGKTQHWDYTAEPITLTAAVLAATSSLQIFASVGVLSLHPAMMAKMAATIDDVAPGRFGLNITTGWHRAEYAQMGMWPGDEYFGYRYDYATEYATILRQLWETGESDFRGKYFEVFDCKLGYEPTHRIQIAAAGASPRGRRFAAEYADFNFTTAKDRDGIVAANEQIQAAAAAQGRTVHVLTSRMVILDDTDESAIKKIESYNAGADREALANQKSHYAVDKTGTSAAAMATSIQTYQAVNPANVFAGSPATVARRFNELAAIGGLYGVLVNFDDFRGGLDRFGEEVLPLLDFDISRSG